MATNFNPVAGTCYPDLPDHKYHGGPGVSSSQLKTLLSKTPAHAKWELDHKEEDQEKKDHFELGGAVHFGVLQPELFDKEVCIKPNITGKGSVKKKAEWEAEHKDKRVLTPEAYDKACWMIDSVRSHPRAREILDLAGVAEHSFYDRHESGLLVKARPDWLVKEHQILMDLKTGRTASQSGFRYHASRYGYHVSASMYREVLKRFHEVDYVFFVVVESEGPFLTNVFIATPEFLMAGREKYEEAAWKWARCAESGDWPGYPKDVHDLTLPKIWRENDY